ncbi:MAG TPA: nitrogenase component 1 [Myxococcota bacterium]|nr:nitrogenase component 1 [Myxococcota bacterium]
MSVVDTTVEPPSGIGRFELRDSDAGDLLGIFMGVHALPGAIMLLHTTVGCKFKTQLQISDHDWGRESHNQRLWTGVDDARIIQGSGRRLVEFATTWYERRRPELFVVTTNASVELSAFDVASAVDELRMRLPIPVLYLKAPGHEGSLYSGYRRWLRALMPLLDPADGGDGAARSVAIGGYMMDRFEMDHAANVNELRRMLTACGLDCRGALLDGSPWTRLRTAGRARNFIWLPDGHGVAEDAGDGRKHIETDLPLGLNGTTVFLERLGKDLGLQSDIIESFRDRELTRAVPLINRALPVMSGARVAVFQPTALAAALTAFLVELGCEVPLVCLTDATDASVGKFFDACGRLGTAFDDESQPEKACLAHRPRVLAGLSRNEQYLAFVQECEREFIGLVVGTSHQKALLRRSDVRVIEMGFPCASKHWLYPTPSLGYNGAVALVQRLVDAIMGVF